MQFAKMVYLRSLHVHIDYVIPQIGPSFLNNDVAVAADVGDDCWGSINVHLAISHVHQDLSMLFNRIP